MTIGTDAGYHDVVIGSLKIVGKVNRGYVNALDTVGFTAFHATKVNMADKWHSLLKRGDCKLEKSIGIRNSVHGSNRA